MTRSDIQNHAQNEKSVTLHWTPNESQKGQNILCFSAADKWQVYLYNAKTTIYCTHFQRNTTFKTKSVVCIVLITVSA